MRSSSSMGFHWRALAVISLLAISRPASADLFPVGDSRALAPGDDPVVLLSPGGASRTTLRFAPEPGYSARVEFETRFIYQRDTDFFWIPSFNLPRLRFVMATTVHGVGANGDIRYSTAFSDTELFQTGGVADDVIESFNALLDAMRSMTTHGLMNSRGLVTYSESVLADGSPPQPGHLHDLGEILRYFAVPLPAEPVGVGARWQTESVDALADIRRVKTVSTYTLKSIRGSVIELDVELTQSADRQSVALSDAPEGFIGILASLRGGGKTTIRIDLAEMLPSQARTQLKNESIVNFTFEDEFPLEMWQKYEIDFRLRPAR